MSWNASLTDAVSSMRGRCAAALLVAALSLAASEPVLAQSATTAAIAGTVAADQGEIDGAEVRVVNRATGFVWRASVRRGRFLVDGLETGGPYAVTVRGIGFRPIVVDNLFLSLGQRLTLDCRLERATVELPELAVAAPAAHPVAGLATVVSDSDLHRLPTRNRDLFDFVRLSPHVSSRFGVSGGGVNDRYDNFQIDGASHQALHGRYPGGTGGGGRSVSLEAVKEYQVLIAPYDVALGNFAGALVNGVTRAGTNAYHGSVYTSYRDETLARDVALLRDAPYDQLQAGGWLGGPILRDRAQFFISGEGQHQATPVSGPYVGQPASSPQAVPARTEDIARFADLLTAYGIPPGSARAVTAENPLLNLFGRLDVALSGSGSRLVLRHSYGRASSDNFSRTDEVLLFPLSSWGYRQVGVSNVTTAQLFTPLGNGASNEVVVDRYAGPISAEQFARATEVQVRVPGAQPGLATLIAGGPSLATDFAIRQHTLEIADNLRLAPGPAHSLTLGAKVEFFGVGRTDVSNAYGSWTFLSLDSLAQGLASSFSVAKDLGGGVADISGSELTAYVGDAVQAGRTLTLTGGVRFELPSLGQRPPYSPTVDALFGRRTDVVPRSDLMASPRVGFTWDPAGDGRNVFRGGAGVFTGRPPFGLWLNAFASYGRGVVQLTCDAEHAGAPPPFDPAYRHPPQACANGQTVTDAGSNTVFLLDPAVSYPRSFRTSVSYDRALPGGRATVDLLYTRTISDYFFVNRALAGPVGTDAHGRVLYGTIDSSGVATPRVIDDRYPQVFDMVPQTHNYSWEASLRLAKSLAAGLTLSAAYTYSRVRDAMTISDPYGYDIDTRPTSGRLDRQLLGVSDLDQPHRIVIAGTIRAPWSQWPTDVSLFYVAGSGVPYTLTAQQGDNGDLNADGTNANDPIYVPRDARDPSEIRFDGDAAAVASQQAAFESLVARTPCLARQRGRIMARNSCRAPWIHDLSLSLRQTLPRLGGGALSVDIQVFNVLNLLNGSWGLVRQPDTGPLRQVGQTAGAASTPVFRFDPSFLPLPSDDAASYYQMQLEARYTF